MGKALNLRKMSLQQLIQEREGIENQFKQGQRLATSQLDAAVDYHRMLSSEIAIKQSPRWKRPFIKIFRRK